MTAWPTPVNPAILAPNLGPATGYALEGYLLNYSETILAPADSQIIPRPTTSNYRLAFNSSPTTPPKSIGQIWPRGQGNRI